MVSRVIDASGTAQHTCLSYTLRRDGESALSRIRVAPAVGDTFDADTSRAGRVCLCASPNSDVISLTEFV